MTCTLTRTARWLNADTDADLPPLLFLTDHVRTPDPLKVMSVLPRDAGVIFRHYDHPDRKALAKAIQEACRKHGRYFSVAGDWRLARHLHADGIHLPEGMIHLAHRLKHAAPQQYITAAVHSARALLFADRSGVDAAMASPVFHTASHPNAQTLGPLKIAAWAHATHLPLYALGGIDETSAQRLKNSGLCGIAAISAFLDE